MLIGELSKKTGISRDALRFYAKRGLIKGQKKSNGYKFFPSQTLEDIELICLGKSLGFTLVEIKKFKEALTTRQISRKSVEKILSDKIVGIDAKIQELQKIKKMIQERLNCDKYL